MTVSPTAACDRPLRIRLLGAAVDVTTAAAVLAFIADRADRGAKALVANHNLRSLYLLRRDPSLAGVFDQADLIEIDSTPLIWWGRLMGLPVSRANRCTYLDWRDDFWRMAAERGWRVFYLGGAPGVADEAARRLTARWPGVTIAACNGFFAPANEAAVVDQINAFAPHILFVGMGMPIQERWIARNLAALKSCVVLPVGAAFDYEAGVQTAAPRLLGALGLEWLFRLASQPRRLFVRYLVEPWALIPAALADVGRYRWRGLSTSRQPNQRTRPPCATPS